MRLYPDGRKELVRGVDMVGTPLVSFKEIIAAADDDAVFNGTCGAESGWVPVSSIAPSVLLRSLELEKTQKTNKKLPIVISRKQINIINNWNQNLKKKKQLLKK